MSGGHYQYLYTTIAQTYEGELADDEMNLLLTDFCAILKELEWWKSCDTGETDYRKAVKAFKTKWFTPSNRAERLKALVEKRLKEVKIELENMIGD